MTVKAPEKLKDSGVDWLGKIPANWKTERAKHLFYQKQRPPKESDDIVTAFRDGEVTLRSLRRTEGYTFADKEIGYQHVDPGDLVIHAMDAFAGAIGVSDSAGKMSPVCSVCAPVNHREVNVEFYVHLLQTMTKSGYLRAISKGIRQRSTDFRYKDFANLHLPVPDKETQNKIVEFINDETVKIDNLIAKQERLLELLEEKRRATITHAVTRGLDPNVELKETNIPWLGKIPKHWSFEKNKYHLAFSKGLNITKSDLTDEGVPVISYGQVHSKYPVRFDPHSDALPFVPESYLKVRGARIRRGDFIFADTSEDYEGSGNFSMLTSDATVLAGYHSIVARLTKDNILPRYKAYYFASEQHRNQIRVRVSGVKVYSISQSSLANTLSLIPTMAEQKAIADFLDKHEQKTTELKQKIQTQIGLLHERRASLVSYTVTGKIEI